MAEPKDRLETTCAQAAARALFDACPDYGLAEELAISIGMAKAPPNAARILSMVSGELYQLIDEDTK